MLYALFKQINQQIVGFQFIEIQLNVTLSFRWQQICLLFVENGDKRL